MPSARTFLELAKAVVAELGVAGGSGPASVVDQIGELKNIVDWTAEADLYVQGLWLDWNFLWVRDEAQSITASSDLVPLPASSYTMAQVDRQGLVLNPGTNNAHTPLFLSWPAFNAMWERRAKTSVTRPTHWSVRPDGRIVLSHTVSATTPVRFDFWRRPTKMTANASTSPIPGYRDRIIVVRAKITYAEREDAPEIMAGASAEYMDLLEKLEAECLPGQSDSRTAQSTADHQAVVE